MGSIHWERIPQWMRKISEKCKINFCHRLNAVIHVLILARFVSLALSPFIKWIFSPFRRLTNAIKDDYWADAWKIWCTFDVVWTAKETEMESKKNFDTAGICVCVCDLKSVCQCIAILSQLHDDCNCMQCVVCRVYYEFPATECKCKPLDNVIFHLIHYQMRLCTHTQNVNSEIGKCCNEWRVFSFSRCGWSGEKKLWRFSCRKWLWGTEIRFSFLRFVASPIIKAELDARSLISRWLLLWPFPGHTLTYCWLIYNRIVCCRRHLFFAVDSSQQSLLRRCSFLINVRTNQAERKYKLSGAHHHHHYCHQHCHRHHHPSLKSPRKNIVL